MLRKKSIGLKLFFLIKIENFYQKNNFNPKNSLPQMFDNQSVEHANV